MWQLFLERFIPVMEDDVSVLDLRDGKGSTVAARSGSRESVSAATPADSSALRA
ncbi:MAG: hypothetical protein WB473_12000 [Pedococcus sp.]